MKYLDVGVKFFTLKQEFQYMSDCLNEHTVFVTFYLTFYQNSFTMYETITFKTTDS